MCMQHQPTVNRNRVKKVFFETGKKKKIQVAFTERKSKKKKKKTEQGRQTRGKAR